MVLFASIAIINLFSCLNTAYASTTLTSDNKLWDFTTDGKISKFNIEEDTNKTNKITIPEKLTANGVSYNITKMDWGAITSNKIITEINIGPNITDLGDIPFNDLESLEKINVR